ncbi:MAG: T9SS type A sorting domain-containing protein [Candidatus Electryonea clarkiae]|nr:T9SS type A sorting domain-containing protein [Candidatus Electryonea clarkiae]
MTKSNKTSLMIVDGDFFNQSISKAFKQYSRRKNPVSRVTFSFAVLDILTSAQIHTDTRVLYLPASESSDLIHFDSKSANNLVLRANTEFLGTDRVIQVIHKIIEKDVDDDPLFGDPELDLTNLDITTAMIDLLDIATVYYWKVMASNYYGESEWSETRSFTTESSDVTRSDSEFPVTFGISSIHPNPFNPTTSIEVTVSEYVHVNLSIFDVQGREVVIMYRGEFTAGSHRFVFDGSSLLSGTYVVRLDEGKSERARGG